MQLDKDQLELEMNLKSQQDRLKAEKDQINEEITIVLEKIRRKKVEID